MYKESRKEGIGGADREVWNRKVQDRQAHMPDWLKNVMPVIIMFIVILILNVMSISITVSVRYTRVRKIEPEITSCFEKNLPGQKIKKFLRPGPIDRSSGAVVTEDGKKYRVYISKTDSGKPIVCIAAPDESIVGCWTSDR